MRKSETAYLTAVSSLTSSCTYNADRIRPWLSSFAVMPAKVRFPRNPVSSVSRFPTPAEQTALEDVEYHLSICKSCSFPTPLSCVLCSTGFRLGRHLSRYMVSIDRKYYGTDLHHGHNVVVEVPLNLRFARQLLSVTKSCFRSRESPVGSAVIMTRQWSLSYRCMSEQRRVSDEQRKTIKTVERLSKWVQSRPRRPLPQSKAGCQGTSNI